MWKAKLRAIVAALASVTGIGLLFASAYLLGFDLPGIVGILAGIVLFVVGTIDLRRQSSAISDKIGALVRDLLLST